MEAITVYSNNSCPNCDNLKKALTFKNVPFQEINISEQPEAAAVVREKGFRHLPVIELNGDWMSGFTPANLNKILQAQNATA
jgi:glutaredoxin-like protein NrdH